MHSIEQMQSLFFRKVEPSWQLKKERETIVQPKNWQNDIT